METLRIVWGIFLGLEQFAKCDTVFRPLCIAPFPCVGFVQQQCAKIGYCVGAVAVVDVRLFGKLTYDEAVAL